MTTSGADMWLYSVEAVVLAEPGVLPVVLVGEDRVLRLAHQLAVLPVGVVGPGPRDVAVEEDAELHGALPPLRT